jgi:drug/metabolite transporter (DMT)-like permease
MDQQKTKRLAGVTYVLLTSLCFGLMPAISQMSFASGLSVETMLAYRYPTALLITWGYILYKKIDYKVTRSQFGLLMSIGGIYVAFIFFINQSYLLLPGAIASILVFLYVSLVVVMEILVGRERANWIRFLCVAMSLGGLVIVVWSPTGSNSLSLVGIIFGLTSGVLYAFYTTVLGGAKAVKLDAIVIVAYVLMIPAVMYIVRCLVSGAKLYPTSAEQAFYILILALFCTFFGTLWWYKSVRLIGSSTASIINTIEPVIAYFGGMLIMQDVLAPNAILGGAIIIVAILILNIAEGTKEKAKPI